MSLVALGDSITLGMGDPMPRRRLTGLDRAVRAARCAGAAAEPADPCGERGRGRGGGAHGSVHFDAAGHPQTYDRRMWSVDRLHPSERGHRLVAHSYAALLGVPGPGLEPDGLPPTRRAKLGWLATKGTRWVVDRSTDLVPYLVAMAAAEWWYGLRGTGYRLDEAAARETTAALRALTGPARLGPQPEPLGLGHGPT